MIILRRLPWKWTKHLSIHAYHWHDCPVCPDSNRMFAHPGFYLKRDLPDGAALFIVWRPRHYIVISWDDDRGGCNCCPKRWSMRVALNLTIERKWLNIIAFAGKREEYRDCDNRQCIRLYNETGQHPCFWPHDIVAVLRNGYRMDSRALLVELVGMDIRSGREAKHPEWGEPTGCRTHFVLKLGEVLTSGTYAEIKKRIEAAGRTSSDGPNAVRPSGLTTDTRRKRK